jgi:hypothetical protein
MQGPLDPNQLKMHYLTMAFTTITLRRDVAKRLRTYKTKGESYSDLVNRLLDEQPYATGGEWLDYLEQFQGRGIFSEEGRKELERLQQEKRELREFITRRNARGSA